MSKNPFAWNDYLQSELKRQKIERQPAASGYHHIDILTSGGWSSLVVLNDPLEECKKNVEDWLLGYQQRENDEH